MSDVILVKEIDYGIACRINDVIYLNKNLKYFKKLQQAILYHELSHSSGFEAHDILLDLQHKHLKGLKLQYWKFVLLHPSTWIEFSPVVKYEGKWAFNLLLCAFYGLNLALLGAILWILL